MQIFITPGDFLKRTTAKGNAQMQSLKTGSYNAVFSKAGFVTLSVPFYVNAGEMTKVVVSMVTI